MPKFNDSDSAAPKIFLAMMSWKAGQGHIEQTLRSIFSQSYSNFSLLIYDDFSPDDPSHEILPLIKNDSRVSFIRGKKRLGSSGASQYVLSMAPNDTKYFAWISDHDLYQISWLENLIRLLEANAEAVVSYPMVSGIDSDGETNNRKTTQYSNLHQDAYGRINSFLALKSGAGNIIWGLYRYQVLKKVGGWPRLAYPDIILLARLTSYGSILQVNDYLHIRREQKSREISLSYGAVGMIARQMSTIHPDSRPWHSYIQHNLVNSSYLFFQEPLKAILVRQKKTSHAFYIWHMYNYYYVLPLIRDFPKRVISNRLTRFLARKFFS